MTYDLFIDTLLIADILIVVLKIELVFGNWEEIKKVKKEEKAKKKRDYEMITKIIGIMRSDQYGHYKKQTDDGAIIGIGAVIGSELVVVELPPEQMVEAIEQAGKYMNAK